MPFRIYVNNDVTTTFGKVPTPWSEMIQASINRADFFLSGNSLHSCKIIRQHLSDTFPI